MTPRAAGLQHSRMLLTTRPRRRELFLSTVLARRAAGAAIGQRGEGVAEGEGRRAGGEGCALPDFQKSVA